MHAEVSTSRRRRSTPRPSRTRFATAALRATVNGGVSAVRALAGIARGAAARLRPAGARALQKLAPSTSRVRRNLGLVTPTGWSCLLLLGACATAGLRLGWQEAWSATAVLAIVVLTAGLWLIPRGGHRVHHELLEQRVTVGDHALLRVTVTNPRNRPLLPARMELPVGPHAAVFAVPTLGPGEEHDWGFVLPTERRGVITVGPVISVTRDPVGLLRHERTRTSSQLVHIHPRTLRLGSVLRGILRDLEGAVTQDLSSSDVSFHALRDYVPGDDRRNVHWKTTARTGRLMVRQFEETRRSSLIVALSTRPEDYAGEEDFETAVSVACSIVLDGILDNREVRFLTQTDALPTTTPLRLLDASCLLKLDATETCDELVRQAAVAHPDASVIVLVTGQDCPDAQLVRSRILTPVSMVMLALSCGARPLSRRRLSSLDVVDLDRLEQLPLALRRMS
ncbi:DUF58 domain-containing protein [Actinomyces oricola]|uniref:DUF58 domain-containing protein n=1 Tax=Actinomyces oricola TaxID=206043 RepID=UPI000FFEC543|nr:DUF58 domain-containing protein [Actinomyces oricola]